MSKFFTILTCMALCMAIFVACGPKQNNSKNTEPKSDLTESVETTESNSDGSLSEDGQSSESKESTENNSDESLSEEKNSSENEESVESSDSSNSEDDYDDDKHWTKFY